MFTPDLKKNLQAGIEKKRSDGTYKKERVIAGAQGPIVALDGSKNKVLNLCANNYLGLSDDQEIIDAAKEAFLTHGYGMSSVRFICGTLDIHKKLEAAMSAFLGTEDTILYTSCFDANGGLFENFLSEEDVIISASLNHASIIDGIRLCKARRLRYKADDAEDLREQLLACGGSRHKIVVTDGVFSMEGDLAPLDGIASICEEFGALLVVDDSHSTGFIGIYGRGTAEHFNVHDKVDLFTGTFGKALGGASGGYISGKKELIEWFRNASRPYLFSNSLAPPLVAGALKAIEIVCSDRGRELRTKLHSNTQYFRKGMVARGFDIKEGIHPIVPIMLGDAKMAAAMADDLLKKGIYVIGFSYPVVPEGKARIRVQISAAHTEEQLDMAMAAFETLGKKYGVLL